MPQYVQQAVVRATHRDDRDIVRQRIISQLMEEVRNAALSGDTIAVKMNIDETHDGIDVFLRGTIDIYPATVHPAELHIPEKSPPVKHFFPDIDMDYKDVRTQVAGYSLRPSCYHPKKPPIKELFLTFVKALED